MPGVWSASTGEPGRVSQLTLGTIRYGADPAASRGARIPRPATPTVGSSEQSELAAGKHGINMGVSWTAVHVLGLVRGTMVPHRSVRTGDRANPALAMFNASNFPKRRPRTSRRRKTCTRCLSAASSAINGNARLDENTNTYRTWARACSGARMPEIGFFAQELLALPARPDLQLRLAGYSAAVAVLPDERQLFDGDLRRPVAGISGVAKRRLLQPTSKPGRIWTGQDRARVHPVTRKA